MIGQACHQTEGFGEVRNRPQIGVFRRSRISAGAVEECDLRGSSLLSDVDGRNLLRLGGDVSWSPIDEEIRYRCEMQTDWYVSF